MRICFASVDGTATAADAIYFHGTMSIDEFHIRQSFLLSTSVFDVLSEVGRTSVVHEVLNEGLADANCFFVVAQITTSSLTLQFR